MDTWIIVLIVLFLLSLISIIAWVAIKNNNDIIKKAEQKEYNRIQDIIKQDQKIASEYDKVKK